MGAPGNGSTFCPGELSNLQGQGPDLDSDRQEALPAV